MNRIIELLQEIFSATEEQTKSFTDAMKAKKIYTASEENLDTRYGKLKTQHETVNNQLKEALAKIATLESGAAGSETMQQDLTAAQNEIATLKAQLAKAQVEGEARVALLAAGAEPDDIGYLMYTLQEDGGLEQDEEGKVKGLAEKIDALKTKKPAHFSNAGDDGNPFQVLEPNKLNHGKGGDLNVTSEKFHTMTYGERLALKQKDEKLYRQLAKN